jgi:hypothetical protein
MDFDEHENLFALTMTFASVIAARIFGSVEFKNGIPGVPR